MHGRLVFSVLGLLASLAQGAPSSSRTDASSLVTRQDDESYLKQNYYKESSWPSAQPVSKTLYVSKQKVKPDGHERDAIVVTEKDPDDAGFTPEDIKIPGPTIEADFGAEIAVKVVNRLKDMGTSIHFHGIRQYKSNDMDGTPSITQCPIAPGESFTYKWRATQYGTSWYHSHVGVQAWDGVFGPIIIKHKEDRKAQRDLGPVVLSDWMHTDLESVIKDINMGSGSSMDNVLINGQSTLPGDESLGQRHELIFHPGDTHRLRLINAAVDTTFRFSIDNHEMEVIAADFVPVKPYKTKSLTLTMGQRYDVVIKADQKASNYWLRAEPLTSCRGSPHPKGDSNPIYGAAIVRYDADSKGKPDTAAWPVSEEDKKCQDVLASNLRPALELNVNDDLANSKVVQWQLGMEDDFRYKWSLSVDGEDSQVSFFQDWRQPTLREYLDKKTPDIQKNHTIELEADKWMKVVIKNSNAQPHPIHLHGHDFYILAQTTYDVESGEEQPDPKTVELNLTNPLRRDVAMLLGGGYLILAIEADNPGAWLMHCHIGFHAAQGMNLQIAEGMDKAATSVRDENQLGKTCDTWATFWDGYAKEHNVTQKDLFEPGP